MNIKRILPYALAPVGLFLLNCILDFGLGLYEPYPWIDIPMHLFGGAAIAVFVFGMYKELLRSKQATPMPLWVELCCVVGGVMIAAVVWEFFEYLVDLQFQTRWQPSVDDTIFDLFNGMLGGTLTGLFFLLEQKKRSST
ncbi:MAG: hypothetical protein HOE53_03460 [Candidatus Magasanikbacteria bacterium]|jgi:hypothetical protein|nr:hypothetical protein [Candidatus Magasanikbacteria bacterium]